MDFYFEYRKIPSDSEPRWKDTMQCYCHAVHIWTMATYPKTIDYSGRESGFVVVKKLPPGQYEIYNYGIDGTNFVSTIHWQSRTNFSIPFTIEAGKATYIGNFARGCWCKRSTAVADFLGYFTISDKSARDIPIARAKDPSLTDINVDVADVSKFNSPMLYTSEPASALSTTYPFGLSAGAAFWQTKNAAPAFCFASCFSKKWRPLFGTMF